MPLLIPCFCTYLTSLTFNVKVSSIYKYLPLVISPLSSCLSLFSSSYPPSLPFYSSPHPLSLSIFPVCRSYDQCHWGGWSIWKSFMIYQGYQHYQERYHPEPQAPALDPYYTVLTPRLGISTFGNITNGNGSSRSVGFSYKGFPWYIHLPSQVWGILI